MAWFYLLLAGLFEVAWAIGLKYTDGFSRLFPSLLTVTAMALSLGATWAGLKNLAGGHGLCGLDWSRRSGHGGARDLSFQ